MQILSERLDVRSLRDVFVLVIARGKPLLKFVCRRLRISEDKLRLKLRRMHSLLQISDWGITTYHRSLHDFFQDKKRAGKYHIHPVRVALVRFQERSRPFAEGLGIILLALAILCLRISLTPLFIIPLLCYTSLYMRSIGVFESILLLSLPMFYY